MELKEEFLRIVQEVWAKLQGLPQASPLELGAFFIIVLFIGALFSMILICCIHCCCCGKPKYQTSRVQPLHPVCKGSEE